MNIVSFAIKKPVSVIVAVILVVLFGLIGLFSMPYQLSPSVTTPEIEVMTTWPGATPYEIEREIIEAQEKVLKGIPGLLQMESSSFNSQGSVTLQFKIGTDVDNALLRVSNKISEVPSYPENVKKPIINASGGATSPVIWMILKTMPGNDRPAGTYKTYFENDIRQHIERVEGVGGIFMGGGVLEEMQITVSPERLAAFDLTMGDLMGVLDTENVNISAGTMGVGRRNYRIRTVAEFKNPTDIENIVIKSTGQSRVFVRDVASVAFGYAKRDAAMMHNGIEGIAIGIKPEPDTNILELSERTEKVVIGLNEHKLKANGVYLDWVYDQRPYINGAINLVRRNIVIGGVLAIIVLLIFLRSISATVVIATAIPISVVGTFILMKALGRNLNVVSLAGISFAVGMLVDNAIVVLENIDRHRKMGKGPFEASYEGATEVWGAVLTSTVTTVAVFLPIIFIQEEAGQLFRDIAIAITCSVSLSLLVSVTVIPMLSKQLFSIRQGAGEGAEALAGRFTRIVSLGQRLSDLIMGLVNWTIKDVKTRLITIISLILFAVLMAAVLMPKMEYLPVGNRNLIMNFLVPPPGLSYEEYKEMGEHIFSSVKPHLGQEHNGLPAIKNMFYVGSERFTIFGAISEDPARVRELMPLFRGVIFSIPAIYGRPTQASIFATRLGGGRTIDIDISGEDLNSMVIAAGAMLAAIQGGIPGVTVRPKSSLELLYPEVRIIPDRERLKSAGLSARELGVYLDVLMDGRQIGDFKEEGKKKIDLVVKAHAADYDTPEALFEAPITTTGGQIVPVSSLSDLSRTSGITSIRHLERLKTVTLIVTPSEKMALQEAMELLEEKFIPEFRAKGLLNGMEISLSGAADKLTETRLALQWNFLLAAFITYLLMSALFGNFIYPLIIMLTVPLAAAGGLIGLKLVNIFIAPQPLDVLTMLGFVILIGVVVNNAILIIHQSLNNIHLHGLDHRHAVLEATRTRLRPIYMSAATSIFGMLPLVLMPGPGSELYRGLGSVVLGGLALSTVFTVFIIPAILIFFIKMEKTDGHI